MTLKINFIPNIQWY